MTCLISRSTTATKEGDIWRGWMGEWVGLKLQFETDGWVGLLLSFLFLARFSVMEEGGEWWSPHAVGGVGDM
jgi:hypothetical protein